MDKQIIITVGRESGSGGHAIAKKVAELMGISCYDKKKLVEGTAEFSGLNKNYVRNRPASLFPAGSAPLRNRRRAMWPKRHLTTSGISQTAERAA